MSKVYDIFGEENYLSNKNQACIAQMDVLARSIAVRDFKIMSASTMRKVVEKANWHCGELFNVMIVQNNLGNICLNPEFMQFLSCLIEGYNDNAAYKQRKTKIKSGQKRRTYKRYFKEFFLIAMNELQTYKSLYSTKEEKEDFKAMKMAMIVFNVILRTCFVRKIPKSLPKYFYEKCIEVDNDFKKFYFLDGDGQAHLTDCGKKSWARRKGGLKKEFSDDIVWLFILYFLRIR